MKLRNERNKPEKDTRNKQKRRLPTILHATAITLVLGCSVLMCACSSGSQAMAAADGVSCCTPVACIGGCIGGCVGQLAGGCCLGCAQGCANLG